MHWISRRDSLRLLLPLLLLAFMLASCSSSAASVPISTSNSNSNSTIASTPISLVTATANSATGGLEPAYNFDKSQTLSGIFLKTKGFVCTEGPFLSNLTIASGRSSYDVGSAQIIQNYIQLLDDNASVDPAGPYTSLVEWIPPRPPQELRWIPGSTICNGDLTITNTSQTSIEVQDFGMRLAAPPSINSYKYQRIPLSYRCSCGGLTPCLYTATVILDQGEAGRSFESPLTSTDDDDCPLPLVIPALGSTDLLITFQDADQRDLIYTGTPTLTLAGMPPITLSALASTLTFTATKTLPCYQFQGNVFVRCSA